MIATSSRILIRSATDILIAGLFMLTSIGASAQACGDSGAGSCFAVNGSPACMSETCCEDVCALDSFCCNSDWDSVCVDEAQTNCSVMVTSIDPDTGPAAGGTGVSVVGELLSGPTEDSDVTIGGQPCTGLTVIDDNEVDCETPAGSGSADVVVVNNEAGLVSNSDVLVNGFSYDTSGWACGDPAAGSCFAVNGSPACMSETCCEDVCALDSFCCNSDWDSVCVDEAQANCSVMVNSVDPDSGPAAGGTGISVVGELLSGPAENTDVTIGSVDGQPCTGLTVIDDNEIECQTPAGSGTVDIVVINNEAELVSDTGVLNDGFTYIASVPPPVITGVTPISGPESGGTMVTISGSDFESGADVIFGVSACANIDVVDDSTIECDTPAGIGTVDITIENPDGQTDILSDAFTYTGNLIFSDRFSIVLQQLEKPGYPLFWFQ